MIVVATTKRTRSATRNRKMVDRSRNPKTPLPLPLPLPHLGLKETAPGERARMRRKDPPTPSPWASHPCSRAFATATDIREAILDSPLISHPPRALLLFRFSFLDFLLLLVLPLLHAALVKDKQPKLVLVIQVSYRGVSTMNIHDRMYARAPALIRTRSFVSWM